jgi:ABC-type transporter Mla maintaining outer membrane lipid asymmetry ATPase subunit MlaF
MMASASLLFRDIPLNGGDAPTVTLEVPEHRAVSVVGGVDSGIDLLGRLAMGLLEPSAGQLTVMGTELSTLSRRELLAYRRHLGYLPAGDGLLQNLTLRENIALPLRFGSDYSENEIDSRLNIMQAAAGLADTGHLRPAQANDEQRRRAALARALAFDPKLVILEEPFVGLTDRAARFILEGARGGDVEQGSRRTVLALGPSLPASVTRRFEVRYRLIHGVLKQEG